MHVNRMKPAGFWTKVNQTIFCETRTTFCFTPKPWWEVQIIIKLKDLIQNLYFHSQKKHRWTTKQQISMKASSKCKSSFFFSKKITIKSFGTHTYFNKPTLFLHIKLENQWILRERIRLCMLDMKEGEDEQFLGLDSDYKRKRKKVFYWERESKIVKER